MSAPRAWLQRLAGVFGRARRDRELAEELESHIEMDVADGIRSGLTPEEARRIALIRLGGLEQTKEKYRDRRGVPWLETLAQDVRFGLRVLRKSPGFTFVAVATLALGIGANTVVFSVVKAVLLAPLPYPQPERLVMIQESGKQHDRFSVSYPDFQDWVRQQDVFENLALYRRSGMSLTGNGDPERLVGAIGSSGLFSALGMTPSLGRDFAPAEDLPSSAPAVILSWRLWQRRFGGDRNVLGRSLTLNEVPCTVIGVMPDIPALPRDAELWTSLGPQVARSELRDRSNHMGYFAVGRLRAQTSLRAASEEMNVIARRLGRQYPSSNRGIRVVMEPMLEALVGDSRRGLVLLSAAVGLVLMIVCANLANLLFARGASRRQELAIRCALGAERGRILRQLLSESTLLAILGGALGVILAGCARGTIRAMSPSGAARFEQARIDLSVGAFAFGLSLLTGLIVGGWPAWRLARASLREAIHEGGRGFVDGRGRGRLRQSLVTAEVALTLALLASAGLMLRSFSQLESVKLGFDPRDLVLMVVDLSPSRYDQDHKINGFFDRLLERVRALPGVRAATLDSSPPLDAGWQSSFDVDGRPPFPPGDGPTAEISVVDADYFRVMRIPIRSGRAFGTLETPDRPFAAVIDEAFARRIWPNESPLGRRVRFGRGSPHEKTFTVIGIVPTVRLYGYGAEPRYLQIYFSQAQVPLPDPTVLVRSTGDPAALAGSIRRIVTGLDPGQPVFAVRTMDQDLRDSVSSPRLITSLLTVFAGIALLLASIGLYGVVSYGVTQQRREIGVRLAFGAPVSRILWLVLSRGSRPAFAGVALGLPLFLASTRLLKSLLFGVSSTDPATLAAVSALLTGVVLLACYVPARRAVRLDPMIALRDE